MDRPMASVELEREIGKLADLPRSELVERWQVLYRTDLPKGISTRLMVRAIAYEVQAKHSGGLSRSIRHKLGEIAGSSGTAVINGLVTLTPGTRLVREWQGKVHVVDVMEEGFRWNGCLYPSLSKIAREITGTRWSGPQFFGLKSKRRRAA